MALTRADDVEQRVAPLDAAAQRALKDAQPRRQIEAGRRQRDLARATQLGSAFAGGTDGLVQRDRHLVVLDWLKTSAKCFYPLQIYHIGRR